MIEEAVRTKTPFELEHRVRRVDGSLGWTRSRAMPIRDERGELVEWVGAASDVTERRRGEAALRENAARQAFLLKLSDALRTLADPVEIQEVAARVLGEHLGVNQAHYGETVGEYIHIHQGYGQGLPPMVGRFRFLDFGERLVATYRAGKTGASDDVVADPTISDAEREVLTGAGIRAYIAVPLVKDGVWVATLAVHSLAPRRWQPEEIVLVEATAERTWAAVEQARAEQSLRVSEENFRTLFETMDEGYARYAVVSGSDGTPVDMHIREVNPAYERLMQRYDPVGKRLHDIAPELEQEWLDGLAAVVHSKIPRRFERYNAALDRWFDVYATPAPGAVDEVVLVFNDITERKQAEDALRASEERHTFLLELSDALRGESDPDAVALVATHMLAAHLQVERCYIARLSQAEHRAWLEHEYHHPDLRPVSGEVRFSDLPESMQRIISIDRVIVDDVQNDPRLSVRDKASLAAMEMGAYIASVLRTSEHEVFWALVAATRAPRPWTANDDRLLEEAAERTRAAVERAHAEAALRTSEERMRLAVEANRMVAWEWDPIADRITTTANFAEIYGLPALAGVADGMALVTPEDLPAHQARVMRVRREGGEYQSQFRIARPVDGRIAWLEERAAALSDDHGRVIRLVGVVVDVTANKVAEAALRASEERFRTLFAAIDEGYALYELLFDDVGHPVDVLIHEVNPTYERLTGRQNPAGKTLNQVSPGLDHAWAAAMATVVSSGEPIRFEGHNAEIDRWFDVFIAPVGDLGDPRILLVLNDITDRRRTTEALRSSEERLQLVADNLPVQIAFYDCALRYVYVNAAVARIFGVSQEAMLGKSIRAFLAPNVFARLRPYFEAALRGEQVRFEDREPDTFGVGQDRWTEETYVPIRGADGDVTGIVALVVDITDHKRTEAALRESEERQRFLLRVGDTLRSLTNELEILRTASRLVGEHLRVDRAFFGELNHDDDLAVMHPDYAREGLPNLAGRYKISDFRETVNALDGGRPYVIADVATSPLLSEPTRAAYLALAYASFFSVPLFRQGTLVLDLSVVAGKARQWTPGEIRLAQEVAERTWTIVERARAEDALRESEERYRLIVEQDSDFAIFTTDTDNRIETWPPGAGRVFGWTADEAVGQPIDITFTPEDRAAGVPAQEFAAARAHGQTPNVRWHLRKDGARVFIEGTTYARRGEDGRFQGVFKIGQDVTARLQAEEARREEEAVHREEEERMREELATQVASATAELRALSRRLLTVQEEERHHLARELHDEVGQMLTGLNFQLAAAAGSNGKTALAEAQATVQALTEQVRQLSMDLRPAVLDSFGLLPALQWHAERFQQRTEITVHLRHHGLERHFPPAVEIGAFRVVQEALTNVARHAETDFVTVQLLADAAVLTIVVRDAGRGFDLSEVSATSGLGGMRERVALLGGTVEIESAPEAGTVITAEIPWDGQGDPGIADHPASGGV